MSKKSSGMQKNIFRPLFHQHQFPNEIFQNRSVCVQMRILFLKERLEIIPALRKAGFNLSTLNVTLIPLEDALRTDQTLV